MNLNEINLSDSTIETMRVESDSIIINIEDWQAIQHTLTFNDVVGLQCFSPEGQEISHGLSNNQDSFISIACEAAQEDDAQAFQCYRLISPWTEKSILTVVARSFTFQ
ncbi:hypothetical protein ACJO2E_12915 [Marinobacter sp. M1N3S26]|uniref:hypothetical protein n=1 Tax=Marinobacter sp. M1N3S26 TaxID=3382299 RepID=UPI00387B9926